MTVTSAPARCRFAECSGVIDRGFCATCGVEAAPLAGPDLSALIQSTGVPPTRHGMTRVGDGVVRVEPAGSLQPDEAHVTFRHRPGSGIGGGADEDDRVLARGQVIAGRYVIERLIGGGGYGTTYEARDRRLDDRHCVLKRYNDADDHGPEAAVALEREALAQISHAHPAIVDVYDYVEDGDDLDYLVMEYLDGPTLRQVQARHADAEPRGRAGALPVAQAAAFVHAVLPALAVMHDNGWVHCDFKPDNLIHVGDNVKMIDLGAARQVTRAPRWVQHTRGYAAPEVLLGGSPTPTSDVYSVGRTLAALVIEDLPLYDGGNIPVPLHHPVIKRHDALSRLLRRACDLDPAARFPDAALLASTLHGVMRQAAALGDGEPRPDDSAWFTPPQVRLDGLDWSQLCLPILPAHPSIADRTAGLDADEDRRDVVALDPRSGLTTDVTGVSGLPGGHNGQDDPGSPDSPDSWAGAGVALSWSDAAKLVRAHCFLGQHDAARAALDHLDPSDAEGPAAREAVSTARRYLEGIVALAAGQPDRARRCFDAASDAAPGEIACVLACAAALEASGPDHWAEAAERYLQVVLTERSWIVAFGGLARVLGGLGRPVDAARVLAKVPATHPAHVEALTLGCRAMEPHGFDDGVARAALGAINRFGPATTDREQSAREARLRVAFHIAARAARVRGDAIDPAIRAALPADGLAMAQTIAAALLAEARATPRGRDRHRLVDMAARTRPWSLR